MARPSLKAEKTEHILQAYECCIAKFGVEGATLEKVAAEANMARPLLRHYIGNQDKLLKSSIDRYFERQQQESSEFSNISSPKALLNELFNQKYFSRQRTNVANDIMIASAFTLAADQYPQIKLKMKTWFESLIKKFKQKLKQLYPEASTTQINTVSIGIIGIYFNLYAMQSINNTAQFIQQSKQAAKVLLDSLPTT